jgi:hypothetical protein
MRSSMPDHDGISISRGALHPCRSSCATRTDYIFEDHLLPENLGHFLADNLRDRIDCATRSKGDDHCDRSPRKYPLRFDSICSCEEQGSRNQDPRSRQNGHSTHKGLAFNDLTGHAMWKREELMVLHRPLEKV